MHLHVLVKLHAIAYLLAMEHVHVRADQPDENTVLAWARLIRARQAVVAAVERDVKAAGFPPLEWYDVLLELDRAPDGAMRPFELEAKLLLAQYNLSRLLDRLQQAGYVEKFRCVRDGRGLVLRITDEGRAWRKRMWPEYAAAIERHVGSRLQDGEAEVLATILSRFLEPRCLTGSMCGGPEKASGTAECAGEPDGREDATAP